MENETPASLDGSVSAPAVSPAPAPSLPQSQEYKGELERAFLLCTEKRNPERVKIIAAMFERFQTDPLKVVTEVFDNYTRMMNDPMLQYTTPPQAAAGQALMTGLMIGAGLQHSEEFRNRIIEFAKSHMPDPTKIMTFEEVKRRKAMLTAQGAL